MRKSRLYLYSFLFGGVSLALFAAMAFTTASEAYRDKQSIQAGALDQGYWIVRSLEVRRGMMHAEDPLQTLRVQVAEIARHTAVRTLAVLDQDRRVLVATDASREGVPWPGGFADPSERGVVLRADPAATLMAFPVHFVEVSMRMGNPMSDPGMPAARAKWIVLGLDASAAYARYTHSLIRSILLSLGTIVIALAAFFLLGMIQRYQLAGASIAKLEQIRGDLERFVPHAVQKLIADDPAQPHFEKVERDATVLFLDIERYTGLSEEIPANALNQLVEKYFSLFLDQILSRGGEVNETAGDGIMAIFAGQAPVAQAGNAVAAAVAIREQVRTLNRARAAEDPEILVNIGINTGPVLLGVTKMKGATGEHLSYTASGMVTNIAARLCNLGTGGEICLGAATGDLVEESFSLLGPEETRLKNVRDPELVYRIEDADGWTPKVSNR